MDLNPRIITLDPKNMDYWERETGSVLEKKKAAGESRVVLKAVKGGLGFIIIVVS